MGGGWAPGSHWRHRVPSSSITEYRQIQLAVLDMLQDGVQECFPGNTVAHFAVKGPNRQCAGRLLFGPDGQDQRNLAQLGLPDLFIEARASSSEADKKLKRAGADRIISPYSIGARRMALLALRPAVVDFIDTVTSRRGQELQMENIAVATDSALVDLTVEQIRKCSKSNVLAINRKSGRLLTNLSGDEAIEIGDRLIIMGTREQLASLEGVCAEVKVSK